MTDEHLSKMKTIHSEFTIDKCGLYVLGDDDTNHKCMCVDSTKDEFLESEHLEIRGAWPKTSKVPVPLIDKKKVDWIMAVPVGWHPIHACYWPKSQYEDKFDNYEDFENLAKGEHAGVKFIIKSQNNSEDILELSIDPADSKRDKKKSSSSKDEKKSQDEIVKKTRGKGDAVNSNQGTIDLSICDKVIDASEKTKKTKKPEKRKSEPKKNTDTKKKTETKKRKAENKEPEVPIPPKRAARENIAMPENIAPHFTVFQDWCGQIQSQNKELEERYSKIQEKLQEKTDLFVREQNAVNVLTIEVEGLRKKQAECSADHDMEKIRSKHVSELKEKDEKHAQETEDRDRAHQGEIDRMTEDRHKMEEATREQKASQESEYQTLNVRYQKLLEDFANHTLSYNTKIERIEEEARTSIKTLKQDVENVTTERDAQKKQLDALTTERSLREEEMKRLVAERDDAISKMKDMNDTVIPKATQVSPLTVHVEGTNQVARTDAVPSAPKDATTQIQDSNTRINDVSTKDLIRPSEPATEAAKQREDEAIDVITTGEARTSIPTVTEAMPSPKAGDTASPKVGNTTSPKVADTAPPRRKNTVSPRQITSKEAQDIHEATDDILTKAKKTSSSKLRTLATTDVGNTSEEPVQRSILGRGKSGDSIELYKKIHQMTEPLPHDPSSMDIEGVVDDTRIVPEGAKTKDSDDDKDGEKEENVDSDGEKEDNVDSDGEKEDNVDSDGEKEENVDSDGEKEENVDSDGEKEDNVDSDGEKDAEREKDTDSDESSSSDKEAGSLKRKHVSNGEKAVVPTKTKDNANKGRSTKSKDREAQLLREGEANVRIMAKSSSPRKTRS